MPEQTFSRIIHDGTDVAGFFLFHPEDMAHRANSPLAWYSYSFACGKEFEAGRLVSFSTGGDGGYRFRVTDGPLSQRERSWDAGAWDFRLRVARGRVLLDNGDCLPNEDFCDQPADADDRWIDLANGHYRVTVHAIDWAAEPNSSDDDGEATPDALAGYVIRFSRIDDINSIPVISQVGPKMLCHRGYPPAPGYDSAVRKSLDKEDVPLTQDSYVIFETAQWEIVPGFFEDVSVPDAIYEAVNGADGSTLLPNRIKHFLLCPRGAHPGHLAAICCAGSAWRSGNEPWNMAFTCERLVRIIARFHDGEWEKATVEALERPNEEATTAEIAAVKSAFQKYAAQNADYRKEISCPDFEAERVEATESPTLLTNLLIHHIRMPSAQRTDLVLRSNAQRVRELLHIISRSQS